MNSIPKQPPLVPKAQQSRATTSGNSSSLFTHAPDGDSASALTSSSSVSRSATAETRKASIGIYMTFILVTLLFVVKFFLASYLYSIYTKHIIFQIFKYVPLTLKLHVKPNQN